MINIHATDTEIQQYAFDQETCDPNIKVHILSCFDCTQRSENYLSLSNEIKNIEYTVLDYDLSKVILDQLPLPEEDYDINSYLIKWILLPGFGFIFLILLAFRDSITMLLYHTLFHQVCVIICIMIFFTLVLGFDLYRSFNRKLKLINV